MNEEVATLAREAKSLQQTLKESFKTKDKDPWDRETDFTRKQLRRICLRLLLLHPYATESKDAENSLWMQTSYAFISIYKQRITSLDRTIHSAPRQQQHQQAQAQGSGQPQQGRGHGGHGVVEYRKLLQRFRQFLADEEKFWIQLIVRIRRIFQLDDAHAALAELDIFMDDPPTENGPPKRNHFQFPSDTDIAAVAPSLTPYTREQRESRMAILSKALVCLGDIERYKEQYNEAGGRPRAGHEDGPPAIGAQKNGRGKKGAPTNGIQPPVMPRLRNYDKAQQCYQQARILLPQDGNPAHQMAILASYQKDVFNSLVHYYRALCVRTPYDTAAENLGTVLSKTMDQWKTRGAKRDKEREKEQVRGDVAPMAPRLRVETFKEKLIVLHALWRLSPEDAEAMSPNLTQKLADDFQSLVSERVLPLDIILKTIVLGEGALWKHRMFRTASNRHGKGLVSAVAATVESSIAAHLLLMHRVLLEVGIVQIAEVSPEDVGESDLAQRITAAFRRTLPALRIASKWLRANLRYVAQASPQGVFAESEANLSKSKDRDRRRGSDRRSTSVSPLLSIPGLSEFWRAYTQFSTALWCSFPVDKLPQLVTTLEEDVEMAGFLPLKKFVPGEVVGAVLPSKEGGKEARTAVFQTVLPEEVHPNEEQLMRIADLLVDAEAIAKDELSPITLMNGTFTAKGVLDILPVGSYASTVPQKPTEPLMPAAQDHPTQPTSHRVLLSSDPSVPYELQSSDHDEDNMTEITRTEDDPVEAAFNVALGSGVEDDDDEDEIVWNPGLDNVRDLAIMNAVPTALSASPPRPLVLSPTMPNLSPHSPKSLSPLFAPQRSVDITPSAPHPASVTTAQDILNVLHRSPPKGDLPSLHMRQVSAPQNRTLFGQNSLGVGPTIWSSTETESAGLTLHGAVANSGGLSYQSYYPQNQLQSSPSATFQSQSSLGLGHGSSPLGLAHYNAAVFGGHQRVQSLSVAHSQLPASQMQTRMSDPFGSYPALTEQAPIAYNTGVPGAYADPVYSRKMDPTYLRQDAPGMYDRSAPYHLDPRTSSGHVAFPPPLSHMAQMWKNGG